MTPLEQWCANHVYFAEGTGDFYRTIRAAELVDRGFTPIDLYSMTHPKRGGLWSNAEPREIAQRIKEQRVGKPLLVYGVAPEQLFALLEEFDETSAATINQQALERLLHLPAHAPREPRPITLRNADTRYAR
jgi:hypothetical protein